MDHTYYELLGCGVSATQDQLLAEYRARVRDYHPDKAPDSEKEFAEKRFCELQAARDVLCDPQKRQHYDLYLSMKPDMSLREWMDNREKLQQTMHWATPREKTLMLPAGNPGTDSQSTPSDSTASGWARHNSSVISAFRSYQI